MVLIADPEQFESGGGASFNTLFYSLQISAEAGSPKKRNWQHGKKELEGNYEDVWFLTKFNKMGIISYHRKKSDSRERVLCHKTFGEDKTCPACESYSKASNKKDHWIKFKEQDIVVPVLAVRRQTDLHIVKNKFQIAPIYWFDMTITNYQEDRYANYLRLRDANEKHPIHKFPYRIFKKKRGEKEKNEFYFKAISESDKTDITFEHPLIDDWLDKKGNWAWNEDYVEMLAAFAIVRFKQYVDPQTGETFDYDGLYDEAMEQYEAYSAEFPDCKIELDEPITAEDDDEELD